jgi:nucleoside permease NupC
MELKLVSLLGWGIGLLAPERRSEMVTLGFRAMIGGLLTARNLSCAPLIQSIPNTPRFME